MADDTTKPVDDNPFKVLLEATLEPANGSQVSSLDSQPKKKVGLLSAKEGGYIKAYEPENAKIYEVKDRPKNPNGVRATQTPTAKVRDAMRAGLARILPDLYDAVKAGRINQLQFADFLAKYSIGTTNTIALISPDVIKRLEAQVSLIATRASWDSAELLAQLRDIWA